MKTTHTTTEFQPTKPPSLIVWKHSEVGLQNAVDLALPQIFNNFVEAKSVSERRGDHVNWMITKTLGKLRKDQPFPILHHFETDENGEDVGPEKELDEEHTREWFTLGLLSHIHGFHGKYALISIMASDLEPITSFYSLYWINSSLIDILADLVTKAYHSQLQYPYFTLHSL